MGMKDIWKRIFWTLIFLFIGINIFILNVIVHEFGHYAAADYYDLAPKIEFDFENATKVGFGFEGITIASTSFIESNNEDTMLAIVLIGPFMNLVLGVICLFAYFFSMGNLKLFSLISMIISFSSFITNMLPIEGTDGALIFRGIGG